ncbi:MAG TPA: hypothetical protein VI454_15945 [Verrucomicrobiae bacterium]|jgi:hypothetical protein
MEEKRTTSFGVPWPWILALVAAGGGAFLLRSPLISSRPAEDHHHEHLLIGDQDVEARLWQDPFKALDHFKDPKGGSGEASKTQKHALSNLVVQIGNQLNSPPTNHVLIVLVLVRGGSYVEDAETRLRSRHAMISALDVAGYAAEDPEHLGFMRTLWTPGAELMGVTNLPPLGAATDASPVLEIPFEWFYARRFHPPAHASPTIIKKVLILWLKEDAFSDLPAPRLAQLKQQIETDLAAQTGRAVETNRQRVKFAILGPRSSTTLQRMLPDFDTGEFSAPQKRSLPELRRLLGDARMYSYSATAMEEMLVRDETQWTNGPSSVAAVLKDSYDLEFNRVVCPDDRVARELIYELRRRGVDLTNRQHCVALLSEHDTLYGRLLPLAFAVEANYMSGSYPDRQPIIKALRANPSPSWPKQYWRFSYLRGVDGKLPGDEPAPRANSSSDKRDAKKINAGDLEAPQGQNQLDYIPRLAALLKTKDEEWRREGTGSLKAIGVLGSDVYDKLLIVQALHEAFPGMIFFTTDLDARFWHSSQMEWTRNLVVASTFGLQLHADLQRRIPPFRDSSQTAMFYAGLRALGHCPELNAAEFTPRVFEIGRNGAYDLSVDPEGDRRAQDTNAPSASLHPARDRPLSWWTGDQSWWSASRVGWALGVTVSLVFLLAWTILLLEGVGDLDLMRIRNFAVGYLILAVLFWLGSGWAFTGFNWREEEPLCFFEGISLWPTEMLRFLAGILGFHFLMKAIHDLHDNTERIESEFCLGPAAPGTQFLTRLAKWRHPRQRVAEMRYKLRVWARGCWLKRRDYYVQFKRERQQEVRDEARTLWAEYLRAGSAWKRTWRVAAAALIYGGFSICLIHLLSPPTLPYRGPVAYRVDVFARYFSLFMLSGLMFFAADATRLCLRMIYRLIEEPTSWPGLDEQARERGLHSGDLEGRREIQFIAQRSDAVGQLILYPFFVLALLILARASYFDNWDWAPSVILIFALNSLYAILLVLALRRAAERARRQTLRHLRDALLGELGRSKQDSAKPVHDRAAQLRAFIIEIEEIREGAFAPLSQHPLIGAILMPFGGAGVMALIEQFASAH